VLDDVEEENGKEWMISIFFVSIRREHKRWISRKKTKHRKESSEILRYG